MPAAAPARAQTGTMTAAPSVILFIYAARHLLKVNHEMPQFITFLGQDAKTAVVFLCVIWVSVAKIKSQVADKGTTPSP